MRQIEKFADEPPFFVIGLAIVQPIIALLFVALFKAAGVDVVALRLITPTAQSAFILWFFWAIGWRRRAGLSGDVREVLLYWYPFLAAFVPVAFYGTVDIS